PSGRPRAPPAPTCSRRRCCRGHQIDGKPVLALVVDPDEAALPGHPTFHHVVEELVKRLDLLPGNVLVVLQEVEGGARPVVNAVVFHWLALPLLGVALGEDLDAVDQFPEMMPQPGPDLTLTGAGRGEH